jgi:hypothetical protein
MRHQGSAPPLLFPAELLEQLGTFKKIFVLVSGGIDSTYLWDIISTRHPSAIGVNCWNPYESSKTLRTLLKDPRMIVVKPATKLDYKNILHDSFLRIPHVLNDIKHHAYDKTDFPCCRYIKHDAFKADPMFKGPGTVVVSGIKAGDGQARAFFLGNIRSGRNPADPDDGTVNEPSYFYMHKEGQLYMYPFRDYYYRDLPRPVVRSLQKKYPGLDHSGCSICPVLVVWKRRHASAYGASIRYWNETNGQQRLFR